MKVQVVTTEGVRQTPKGTMVIERKEKIVMKKKWLHNIAVP